MVHGDKYYLYKYYMSSKIKSKRISTVVKTIRRSKSDSKVVKTIRRKTIRRSKSDSKVVKTIRRKIIRRRKSDTKVLKNIVKLTKKNLMTVNDDNSYIYIGHGTRIDNDYISLTKDQSVILLCKDYEKYYLNNEATHGAWKYIYNCKTIEEFKKNILTYWNKKQLCIFKKKVPNINLWSFSLESKYWRHGLYKIPILFSINHNGKRKFLKKNT